MQEQYCRSALPGLAEPLSPLCSHPELGRCYLCGLPTTATVQGVFPVPSKAITLLCSGRYEVEGNRSGWRNDFYWGSHLFQSHLFSLHCRISHPVQCNDSLLSARERRERNFYLLHNCLNCHWFFTIGPPKRSNGLNLCGPRTVQVKITRVA